MKGELIIKSDATGSRAIVPPILADARLTGLLYAKTDEVRIEVAISAKSIRCGWAKRRREHPRVARALALVQVIWNRKERTAHMLVWAGADPHQRVAILEWKRHGSTEDEDDDDTYTAVEMAVYRGQGKLLRILWPDPQVDDFARLYANVSDPETVDLLMRIKAPEDWSAAVRRNVWWIPDDTFEDRSDDHRWCLERIAPPVLKVDNREHNPYPEVSRKRR
jgi:hypothetical protein